MPNRYYKKIAYQDNDIQRLTEKHIQYMREMHEQYEIPEFVKLQWLAARKNVQVAFFTGPLKKWEQISINEFGKKHPFQEYKNSIVDERFSYLTIRLSKAINIVASTLRAYYMWGVIF